MPVPIYGESLEFRNSGQVSSKLCRLVEGNTQKFTIKYIYKCEKSPARRVRQTMGLALDHFGDAVECDGDIMLLGIANDDDD